MGSSFLNAFMPTLPWWFLVTALVTVWVFVARAWVRRWNAQRRRIEHPVQALRQAQDALATVISDSAVFGDTRDQALSAYQTVTTAISKETRAQLND